MQPTLNPPDKTVERNIYLFSKVILHWDFNPKRNAWKRRYNNIADPGSVSLNIKNKYLIAAP
jgi:hypothetical protein